MAKTTASPFLLKGAPNNFAWDRDSEKELFGFGQWVLVSSILTFQAGEGDKLLIGAFLGKTAGIFYIGQYRTPEGGDSKKPAVFDCYRMANCPVFRIVWRSFMSILHDQRYAESWNMLRMLAMGSLVGIIGSYYNGLLWAKGMVRVGTMLLAVQIIIQVLGMIVGHHFLGARGVVLSVALIS